MDQDTVATDPSQGEAPWSVVRLFHRVFGRHMLNAALLVCMVAALGGALSGGSELTEDADLWWHLANARALCSTHHFIRMEPYAFTVFGERWIDPEWLSELPYWLAYSSLGLIGIHLVALIAFCANLLWIYFRSCSKARHKGAAFWTAVLCFFLMTVNAGARTIVIAYLALSAEMLILDAAENGKTRLLWLLPPLLCLWINLHGSWAIGLGLLALYIVCGLVPLKAGAFEQPGFSPKERNRLLLVFLACLAALLVNPYGWRLIWSPFDMMLNQKVNIAVTQEWRPLSMGDLTGKAAAIFIVLLILANFVRGRKWKAYELAFILFAWYAAFAHQRFAFMACILAAPWLAADLARSFFHKAEEKTIPALNALFAAGAVCALIFLLPSNSDLQRNLAARYPLRSIALIQPSWRTFNDHDVGGMMDFHRKPVFVDSRDDTFEHHGVLQNFFAIESLHDPLQLLDRYRVDHALIHANTPLSFVLERSPNWRVEMREGAGDSAYELFAKTDSPPAGKPQ